MSLTVTGGTLEKPRITIRLESEQEYQVLNTWAEQEFISVPQLVKSIVRKALSSRIAHDQTQTKPDSADTLNMDIDIDIPTLVKRNMNKLKKTGVKSLPAISNGKLLPSVTDFSIIAAELELTPEQQRQIWMKTFNSSPKHQEGTYGGDH